MDKKTIDWVLQPLIEQAGSVEVCEAVRHWFFEQINSNEHREELKEIYVGS